MLASFLQDMRISRRMAAAMALPVLAFLVIAGVLLSELHRTASQMGDVRDMAELAPRIGRAIHELQKERGQSAVYLSSGGKKFGDALPRQRQQTDRALAVLRDAFEGFDFDRLSGRFAEDARKALERLDGLASMRERVDGLKVGVSDAATYYTRAIGALLEMVERMGQLSTDAELVRRIDGYASLLQAKERAGLERAVGGAGFALGRFVPALHRRFLSLRAEQEVFLDRFLRAASPEQRERFRQMAGAQATARLEKMRRAADESAATGGGTVAVDPGAWFDTATERIDLLAGMEELSARELAAYATQARSRALAVLSFNLLGIVALLGVVAWFGGLIARSITEPLANIVERMKALATGDLDIDIPGRERRDEIGDMARAVQVFREQAIENRRMEAEKKAREEQDRREAAARAEEERRRAAEELAREEARRHRVEERMRASEAFTTEVGEIITNIAGAADQLRESAAVMAKSAQVSRERTRAVGSSIDTTRENAESVSEATGNLSQAIDEISQQVILLKNIADGAVRQSRSADGTVRELSDAVEAIGEVIDLITDVAEQTNLLALNATIEAARAGEAGKGFAVVASEVKSLANQTAKATDEIRAQIENVQARTRAVVSDIRQIGSAIGEIDGVSASIAAAVEEQSVTTREIARNVGEVSNGAAEMSEHVRTVEKATDDTGEAAGKVLDAAEQLAASAASLKGRVEDFARRIASA